MTINFLKVKAFFKSIWNSLVGISLELLLAYVFIFVGLLVCLAWWGIYR